MLTSLAFAVMIGLGFYFNLTASYHFLLFLGSIMGGLAGFASFSKGSRFAHGRGDVRQGTG